MPIFKNAIDENKLCTRFVKLCEKNWKVKSIKNSCFPNNYPVKLMIDNWPIASRPSLLDKLRVRENPNLFGVYHDIL